MVVLNPGAGQTLRSSLSELSPGQVDVLPDTVHVRGTSEEHGGSLGGNHPPT